VPMPRVVLEHVNTWSKLCYKARCKASRPPLTPLVRAMTSKRLEGNNAFDHGGRLHRCAQLGRDTLDVGGDRHGPPRVDANPVRQSIPVMQISAVALPNGLRCVTSTRKHRPSAERQGSTLAKTSCRPSLQAQWRRGRAAARGQCRASGMIGLALQVCACHGICLCAGGCQCPIGTFSSRI
jgi:hypothetical protein